MPSYFSKPIYIYEMPECVIVFYVSITNLLKAITTSHFTYGSITAGRWKSWRRGHGIELRRWLADLDGGGQAWLGCHWTGEG